MKTLTLILAFAITAGNAHGQTVEETRQQMIAHTPAAPSLELPSDWQPATELSRADARSQRNSGVALTLVGIGLEITAAVMWGYAMSTQFGDALGNAFGANPPLHHDTAPYEYGAIGAGLLGLGAIIAGVDMWIDGQSRLNRLRITPTLGGASATITF